MTKVRPLTARALIGMLLLTAMSGCGPTANPEKQADNSPPVAPPAPTTSPAQSQESPPASPDKQKDAAAPEGMVWIRGGTFMMGNDDKEAQTDERPVHEITLDGFWMDRCEVTNEQFEKFAKATDYVTIAERAPDPKDFPGAAPEALVPGALVFTAPKEQVSLRDHSQWWQWVPGASWRKPDGPGSDIKGREKHPVVQVCWHDAVAYAAWAGKRLPAEAEWEYAARGGLEKRKYVWGNEQMPEKKWLANIWQGEFPVENKKDDGHYGAAPVASFAANGFGLHDMSGNVWEWCADLYLPDYYYKSPKHNPPGPATSHDPNEPGVEKRVQRGGSFLCSDLYCTGYRPSARMKNMPDTGTNHTGFRCVKNR